MYVLYITVIIGCTAQKEKYRGVTADLSICVHSASNIHTIIHAELHTSLKMTQKSLKIMLALQEAHKMIISRYIT